MPIKAVLIGDSGVGKTCLYDRIANEVFDDGHTPTIGGSFRAVSLKNVKGDVFEIGLWDTAGQEKFRTLIPMYFERAQILIYVYSITDMPSIEHIPEWHDLAMHRAEPDAKVIILGNKLDLDDGRVVSFDELEATGDKLEAFTTMEVSAMASIGMDGITDALVRACEALSPAPVGQPVFLVQQEPDAHSKKLCC